MIRETDRSGAAGKGGDAARSRRKGWVVIAVIAVATLVFFVLGTMDADLRYDLIGL
jgi:hypothetical protein